MLSLVTVMAFGLMMTVRARLFVVGEGSLVGFARP
jgi:hypothetical protein